MNILKETCNKYNLDWKFVKFLFVGAINTGFGYCAFAFFTFLNLHYVLATFFATILGIMFNFKTTGGIVFKSHDNSLIYKFFIIYGIMYLVSIVELRIFELCNLTNMYINYAILIFPNAMISFQMMKRFVFVEKSKV